MNKEQGTNEHPCAEEEIRNHVHSGQYSSTTISTPVRGTGTAVHCTLMVKDRNGASFRSGSNPFDQENVNTGMYQPNATQLNTFLKHTMKIGACSVATQHQ